MGEGGNRHVADREELMKQERKRNKFKREDFTDEQIERMKQCVLKGWKRNYLIERVVEDFDLNTKDLVQILGRIAISDLYREVLEEMGEL